MKKLFATLLGVSLISVLSACGGGGGGAEVPDTPEGQAFLPYAESILESEASGRTLLRPENEGAAGLLRAGSRGPKRNSR